MRITITGKNYKTNKHLEDTIDKKLDKLGKFFSDDIAAKVLLSTERGKDKIEVNINAKGAQFRTEQVGDDIYECIDKSVDKLASQISKFKGKLQKRYNDNKSVRFEAIPAPEGEDAQEIGAITRTKSLDLTPMAVEDAILQMEMIDHDFYVFINDETDLVNIVYKKNDGNYGVLETKY